MIVGFRNFQDTGKTALSLLFIRYIVESLSQEFGDSGYKYSDVYANLSLKWSGANSLTNHDMKKFIKSMVTEGLVHKIVLIDECDRLFPARFWQDKQQTEALLGLWQDVKLFNVIFYTAHSGTGVDITLRETTQIEIEPLYFEEIDTIEFRVYNAMHGVVYEDSIENVSSIFDCYNRWEIIGKDSAFPSFKPPILSGVAND